MIAHKTIASSLLGVAALSGVALAGDVISPVVAPQPAPTSGGWCHDLKTFGLFHQDKNDPYIQEIKFFGRLQVQYGYIDGEGADGNGFSEGFDEFRRVRVGSSIKFLNGFKLKGNINIANDDAKKGGNNRNFEYKNWDELKLSYTFKDVAGFDKLSLTYGRQKVAMGHESHTSSKKIKTVERSAIINKIYDNRYTGLTVGGKVSGFSGKIGIFSLDDDKAIADWDDGVAAYLTVGTKVYGGKLVFDFFYNFSADEQIGSTGDDEIEVGYEWAASLSYERDFGNWNLMVNGIIGDNGDSDYQSHSERTGTFYGVIIMPSTYIIEDTLEFVARYTYQASEESEGIRTNSRYFRAAHGGDVNSGRGDSHHSIYAGLNWYLCGNHSKFMIGAEYETLDTPKGDADATTLWAAYRMYF